MDLPKRTERLASKANSERKRTTIRPGSLRYKIYKSWIRNGGESNGQEESFWGFVKIIASETEELLEKIPLAGPRIKGTTVPILPTLAGLGLIGVIGVQAWDYSTTEMWLWGAAIIGICLYVLCSIAGSCMVTVEIYESIAKKRGGRSRVPFYQYFRKKPQHRYPRCKYLWGPGLLLFGPGIVVISVVVYTIALIVAGIIATGFHLLEDLKIRRSTIWLLTLHHRKAPWAPVWAFLVLAAGLFAIWGLVVFYQHQSPAAKQLGSILGLCVGCFAIISIIRLVFIDPWVADELQMERDKQKVQLHKTLLRKFGNRILTDWVWTAKETAWFRETHHKKLNQNSTAIQYLESVLSTFLVMLLKEYYAHLLYTGTPRKEIPPAYCPSRLARPKSRFLAKYRSVTSKLGELWDLACMYFVYVTAKTFPSYVFSTAKPVEKEKV